MNDKHHTFKTIKKNRVTRIFLPAFGVSAVAVDQHAMKCYLILLLCLCCPVWAEDADHFAQVIWGIHFGGREGVY